MSSGADDTADRTSRGAALDWAGRARRARHDTREQLRDGELALAQVLDAAATDELVGELKLLWVLESLPGARKVDTRRRLGELGLREAARLRSLDEPTRRVVLDTFGPEGGSR
ncbi:MAG: integration host factor, actinobacterial type [Microthrixaceae bacterium]